MPDDARELRLFTATLRFDDGVGTLEMFHACRVDHADAVMARLRARIGPSLADAATIREGVDPLDHIAASLLSPAMLMSLQRDGDLPSQALAGGADLQVIQRRG